MTYPFRPLTGDPIWQGAMMADSSPERMRAARRKILAKYLGDTPSLRKALDELSLLDLDASSQDVVGPPARVDDSSEVAITIKRFEETPRIIGTKEGLERLDDMQVGEIRFSVPGSRKLLQLLPEGCVLVGGVEVDRDPRVADALREFLDRLLGEDAKELERARASGAKEANERFFDGCTCGRPHQEYCQAYDE